MATKVTVCSAIWEQQYLHRLNWMDLLDILGNTALNRYGVFPQ